MNQLNALNAYKSVGVQSAMTDATPHQMIGMLFDGLLERVASAKGAVERNETARRGELISKAIAIVDGLRASLDHQQGGEISANLAALYDYMEQLLMAANLNADAAKLDEVLSLVKEIRQGWQDMPEAVKKRA